MMVANGGDFTAPGNLGKPGNLGRKLALRTAANVGLWSGLLSALPATAADLVAATPDATKAGAGAYLSNLLDMSIQAAVQTVVPLSVVGIFLVFLIETVFSGKKGRGDEEDGFLSSVTSSLGKKGTPAQRKRKATGFDIEVTKLNERYAAANNVLKSAFEGESAALLTERREKLTKALTAELISGLDDETLKKIVDTANAWAMVDQELEFKLEESSRNLRVESVKVDNSSKSKFGMSFGGMFGTSKTDEYCDLFQQKVEAESEYLQALAALFPAEKRDAFAKALEQRAISPLGMTSLMASGNATAARAPRVYHLVFKGDVAASGVEALRNEISAVVGYANATHGDEVLLELESPGGTVVGYGLAGAQLERIKSAGLPLTICVGQVAASGGYLMACTGDRIVASPFAVIGSIGVITEIPNVYERLTKEGIVFNTVTAGKFKRSLTPTKKTTEEDIEKTKADLEDILTLFRNFVGRNRPNLDLDKVATGDTWFGPDAKDIGLVDELGTLDDLILDFIGRGCEVVTVQAKTRGSPINQLLGAEEGNSGKGSVLAASLLRVFADALAPGGGSSTSDALRAGVSDRSADPASQYLFLSPDEQTRL